MQNSKKMYLVCATSLGSECATKELFERCNDNLDTNALINDNIPYNLHKNYSQHQISCARALI